MYIFPNGNKSHSVLIYFNYINNKKNPYVPKTSFEEIFVQNIFITLVILLLVNCQELQNYLFNFLFHFWHPADTALLYYCFNMPALLQLREFEHCPPQLAGRELGIAPPQHNFQVSKQAFRKLKIPHTGDTESLDRCIAPHNLVFHLFLHICLHLHLHLHLHYQVNYGQKQ